MHNAKPTTADIVSAAYQIIAFPLSWTRGSLARDADGNAVQPTSPTATSWCALGALQLATHRLFPHPADIAERALANDQARRAIDRTVRGLTKKPADHIAAYNDRTNHDCIMHTLDIAFSDLVPATPEPTQ